MANGSNSQKGSNSSVSTMDNRAKNIKKRGTTHRKKSPRKKKNGKRKKILIAWFVTSTCILLGLLICLFVWFGPGRLMKDSRVKPTDTSADNPAPVEVQKENAENVLTTYMTYINTQDYDKMYDLLSDESKINISKEGFIERNQKIYEGIETKNVNIEVNEVSDDQVSKNIKYTTKMETIAGDLEFNNNAVLSKNQDGEYNLEWNSTIIFPQLTKDDKVQVSTLSGERGSILDRNGTILAGSGTVASVGFVPGKMSEDPQSDIVKAAEILNLTVDTINEKLNASYVTPDMFIPLKSISQSETQMKEELLQIAGIMITDVEARVYPLGEATAHLTGYIQNINAEELETMEGKGYNSNSVIGKTGLEYLLEDRIHGVDGYIIYIADANGNKKENLAATIAQKGEDITLTIDAGLQSELYEQLKVDKSSSVVMNPRTGEILALLSTPAYDPNEFILGMSNERWQELNTNEGLPLFNRFKSALSPGSTFKPVIAAIALDAGIIGHEENLGDSGLSWQKDSSWGSYSVTTLQDYQDYGDQSTMRNALVYSDNIYFAKAALEIGKDTLAQQLLSIGFGESMPFEFGLTSSSFGTDDEFASEIQLADSGYGQGQILVNPVHMASIYSAFVNEGNMVMPYLEFKEDAVPQYWKQQIFSKETADIIKEDLVQVVDNPKGSGHSVKIDGMKLAAKTGTAEIKASQDDETGTELGWFNAFTADEESEKQYLALVMVEDVKERGGSHYVIPIVKHIFE